MSGCLGRLKNRIILWRRVLKGGWGKNWNQISFDKENMTLMGSYSENQTSKKYIFYVFQFEFKNYMPQKAYNW